MFPSGAPSREQLESLLAQGVNATQLAKAEFVHDVLGFVHAVDWTERWLLALCGWHLAWWVAAIALRRSADGQMALLVALLGATYAAERLNSVAHEHWREFAGQDYFDRRGVFVSVVYSLPMLVLAFFVLLNGLRLASRLLIQVKRKEISASVRSKAKAKGKEKAS